MTNKQINASFLPDKAPEKTPKQTLKRLKVVLKRPTSGSGPYEDIAPGEEIECTAKYVWVDARSLYFDGSTEGYCLVNYYD